MTTGASASQRQHRRRFDQGSLSRRQRRQGRKSTSRYSTERLRSWVVLPYPAAEHLRQVQNVFAEIVFFGNSLPARLGHLAAQLWVPDKAPDLLQPTQSTDSAQPDLPGALRIHQLEFAALRGDSTQR